MKTLSLVFTILLSYPLAGDEPKPEDPFAGRTKVLPWPSLPIAKIDLGPNDTVSDAIKQIVAGLPPDSKSALVVEIPEAKLKTMKLKSTLRLRDVPLGVALRYLEQCSPIGGRLWNNAWYIRTPAAGDIIAAEYEISKESLRELGITAGPGRTVATNKGQMWPPDSNWRAAWLTHDPDTKGKKQDTDSQIPHVEMGVLQVLASRSFQKEIEAVLLLKERGYETLTLVRQ